MKMARKSTARQRHCMQLIENERQRKLEIAASLMFVTKYRDSQPCTPRTVVLNLG